MARYSEEQLELIAENAVLKKENELLRDRIEEIRGELVQEKEQVLRLQDALVAKESPLAYSDQRDAARQDEAPPDWVRDQIRKLNIERQIVDMEEQPLFRDAQEMEDMMDTLTQSVGVPSPPSPHGNEES